MISYVFSRTFLAVWVGLFLLPLEVLGEPQKDLCDAIVNKDITALERALMRGASLVLPCETKTPLDLAQETGNQALREYILKKMEAPIADVERPKTPELQTEEILKDFFLMEDTGPRFKDKLPEFLLNQAPYLHGSIRSGRPLYELDKSLIKKPTTIDTNLYRKLLAEITVSESVIGKFGSTPQIDIGAFSYDENPKSLQKIYQNLNQLKEKQAIIKAYISQLNRVRDASIEYDNYDELGFADTFESKSQTSLFTKTIEETYIRVVEESGIVDGYIAHIFNEITESTLKMVEKFLGVGRLSEYYRKPLRNFMAAGYQESSFFRLLVDQVYQAATSPREDLEPILLNIAETIGYIQSQAARVLPDDEIPVLFQFLPRFLSLVVLGNIQFDTDSIPSLVISENDLSDQKLSRSYNPIYHLLELTANGGAERQNYLKRTEHLSEEQRLSIHEEVKEDLRYLGPEGIVELRSQLGNAQSKAKQLGYPDTLWSCPMAGLGTLFHAGWTQASVPDSSVPKIFKAIRTLGMTRGMSFAFATAEMDFSFLGPIKLEQAKALIYYVQKIAEASADPKKNSGHEELNRLFSQQEISKIVSITKEFVEAKDAAIVKIHDSIRRSAGGLTL